MSLVKSRILPASTLAALAFAFAPISKAAIIISGNVSTPGAPCTLQITTDIVFNVLIAGASPGFLLDGLASSADSSLTFATLNSPLSLTLNGVPAAVPMGFGDNTTAETGSFTSNDGLISFPGSVTLAAGDVLVLKAGTYNFAGVAQFNPLAAGTFTGDMWLYNNAFVRISDIASAGPVPEPSTALLGFIGALSLLRRKRA